MKQIFSKYIFSRKALKFAGLAVFLIILFLVFQNLLGYRFADPDAFYHARMAQLLADHFKSWQGFSWLPFTSLASVFADQQYLFHWLLVPFIGPESELQNLHWAIIILSSLAALSWLGFLEKLQIKYKWFWLIIFLLGSADFLFRINLVKANTLSLIIIFFGLIAVLNKNYLLLFLFEIIFVLSYGAFILLPVILFGWAAVTLLIEKKMQWQPLAAVTLGMLCGLFLHPQSRQLLPFLYNQIFVAGLGSGGANNISVGQEWLPYGDFNALFSTNSIIFTVWISALFLYIRDFGKNYHGQAIKIWQISLSMLFFLLMLKSRRCVDYWAPFAVLSSAYIFDSYLRKATLIYFKESFKKYWQMKLISTAFVLLLLGGFIYNVRTVLGYFEFSTPIGSYDRATQYLKNHSMPGDIVFNSQWDQFPQLFWLDTKNYYIAGLDPTFLYMANKDLYRKWQGVSDDNYKQFGNPQDFLNLINNFRAKYLFIEIDRNPNLISFLGSSSLFTEVYNDGQISIYKPQPR